MTTALIYLVVMVLVAAVVFLLASFVFGRGEELAPLPPGASPTRLPASDVTADDVRDLRFQQVLRGYKMTEVDWVLERLAGELDALRARVAELEAGPDGSRHGVSATPFEAAEDTWPNGSGPADEPEPTDSEPTGSELKDSGLKDSGPTGSGLKGSGLKGSGRIAGETGP